MIAHDDLQQAIRDRLITLSVLTTGAISLASTASSYTRASGSFVTDGFAPGMELDATGFGNAADGLSVVMAVAAGTLTVDRALPVTSAAAGRTLAVGLPSRRAWENVGFTPPNTKPYIEEQYIPGPSARVTLGTDGDLEATPMYQVQIHLPEGYGKAALRRYLDALYAHFKPTTALTVNGDILRVRGDVGPFGGQILAGMPGFAVAPLTIAFRLRTANT